MALRSPISTDKLRGGQLLSLGDAGHAAVVLCSRGGTLLARGSRDAPITFTLARGNDADYVKDVDVPSANEYPWGGLLLHGRAPVAAERVEREIGRAHV